MAKLPDYKSDLELTYDGVTIGFRLATDENGNKRFFPGFAPRVAPQVRQESVSYNYLPPEIDVVAAFEDWVGGGGYAEAQAADVAPLVYNYTQGIDLSTTKRGYVAAKQQAANVAGGAATPAPVRFWDGSLGTFLAAGTFIYEWDTTAQTWTQRDSAAGADAYTDITEMDGIMYAGRGNGSDYKFSTDGITWTAFTDSDDNFLRFAVRGIASAEAVMWGLKTTGVLKNSTNPRNGGVAWSAGDAVAHTSETMQSLVEANDDLYVFTTGGIYRYTGTAQESVWTGGRRMFRTTNGTGAFLWEDGRIYVPYGDRLLQYDPLGDTLSTPSIKFVFPISPMEGNSELNGSITTIAGDAYWLYVAVKNAAGNTYILRGKPDSGIWHTFLYLGANDCNAMALVGGGRFHTDNPVLVYGYGAATRFAVLPRAGLRPEDDANYRFDTAEGTLYGPWVSVGTRQFHKLLATGRILAENVTAGRPITLSYEIDNSGTTVTLVSAVSSGATSTDAANNVRFLRVRPIITMSTGAENQSPRLLGALFHTAMLLPRKRMWTLDLELSPVVGSHGARWTHHEQEPFLFNMGNKVITLFDRHQRSFTTILQSLEPIDPVRSVPAGDVEVYRVVLTEVTETTEADNTLTWDLDQWDSGKVYG